MLKFIDVSLYDPIVKWENYTWDGAFIKASEGLKLDINFDEQWSAARGYTIRSAYHFFRPFVDPVEAANRFVGILGDDRGELPAVLDLEKLDGYTSGIPERALKWLGRYRVLTGKIPIIYTSPGFASTVKLYLYKDFADYPFWCAAYPWDEIDEHWSEVQRKAKIRAVLDNPDKVAFALPISPFREVEWWQWTGKCAPEYVPGYPLGGKMAVDISFYRGTMKELFDKYKIQYIPKGDTVTDTLVTMTARLMTDQKSNLRPNPGLSAGLIRQLTGPLHVEAYGQKLLKDGFYWNEVTVVETGERGWIAWTTSYTDIQIVPSTTPAPAKVVKSTLYFDNGTTQELFPKP